MKVEVVLTEADIAQEFAEAVEARDLPEKFFFWFPRSASAWSTLAADPALYGGLGQTWIEMAARCEELAADFGRKLPLISFGAGDGVRDRILMDAFKKTGIECLYFPVDASTTMLEMACAGAEDEDIDAIGIKADISSPVHLVYAADAAEPPRLFVLSGNTLASFDPLVEIRYVAQCMKPGDRLIVDGEIFDADKTTARRDNAAVRKFILALLGSLGIQQDDGEVRFNLKHDERYQGLHLTTRHFRAEMDLTVTAVGQAVGLQRGERIGLNFQYAYTPEAFRWLLEDQGGLDILRELRSPDGRFLTAVCKK
jgi:L-histidine N-alpha-methyltransferase